MLVYRNVDIINRANMIGKLLMLAVISSPSHCSMLTNLNMLQNTEPFHVNHINLDSIEEDIPWFELVSSITEQQSWNKKITFRMRNTSAITEDLEEDGLTIISSVNHVYGRQLERGKWLFPDNSDAFSLLRILKPSFESRVYLYKETRDFVDISEFYYCSSKLPPNEKIVHSFQRINTQYVQKKPYLHVMDRRTDLQGVVVRAAVTESTPSLTVPDPKKPETSFGLQIDLIRAIEKRLNFTLSLSIPRTGTYGVLDKNGSWDGMMAQLISGDADIALILQVTKERANYVDFTGTIISVPLTLAYKRTGLTTNIDFLRMLSGSVWLVNVCICASFMVISLIIATCYKRKIIWKVCDFIVPVLGGLLNQGSDEQIKTVSMRILCVTYLWYGYLSVNLFSANLTSSISVKRDPNEIKSLFDIDEFGYNLYVLGSSSLEQLFVSSKENSIHKKLWNEQLSTSKSYRPTSVNEIMEHIINDEKSATLIFSVLLQNWIADNTDFGCKLKLQTIPDGKAIIAFGLSKRFQFASIIDHQISKLRESGVIEKIERKWLQAPEIDVVRICGSASEDDVEITLGLDSAKFFFFILLAGVAGATTILATELVIKRIFLRK